MKPLSPNMDFPARLFCASLARLFMFVLGLFGLLSRPLMPATSVATESKKLTQSDARGHERVRVRIQPGESFAGLLVRHGLRPPSVKALIHTLRPFLNTRKLPVGQKVDLVIDTEADSVRALELVVSKRVVRANVTADGWLVDQWAAPFSSRSKVIRGTVTDNFVHSLLRSGLTLEQVKQLRSLFTPEIDLLQDSQPGDAYAITISELSSAVEPHAPAPMTAVSLKIAGEYYSAFAYGEINGRPRYFDSEGLRLPHRFLAAPLIKYERISSSFTRARSDPITGKVRPHEAIDYVAPRGTAVVAVASGVVEFAGWHGAYGYFVEIDHGDGYHSAYGHLSSFGAGVAREKWVEAGDIIGYVGNTGYSTGPHLHFEFSRNEEKLNYLTARKKADQGLTGAELRRFRMARDEKLAAMRNGVVQISQFHNASSY